MSRGIQNHQKLVIKVLRAVEKTVEQCLKVCLNFLEFLKSMFLKFRTLRFKLDLNIRYNQYQFTYIIRYEHIMFQSKYNPECNIGCLTFAGSTFDHPSAELGFSGRKKSSSHYDDQCFLPL